MKLGSLIFLYIITTYATADRVQGNLPKIAWKKIDELKVLEANPKIGTKKQVVNENKKLPKVEWHLASNLVTKDLNVLSDIAKDITILQENLKQINKKEPDNENPTINWKKTSDTASLSIFQSQLPSNLQDNVIANSTSVLEELGIQQVSQVDHQKKLVTVFEGNLNGDEIKVAIADLKINPVDLRYEKDIDGTVRIFHLVELSSNEKNLLKIYSKPLPNYSEKALQDLGLKKMDQGGEPEEEKKLIFLEEEVEPKAILYFAKQLEIDVKQLRYTLGKDGVLKIFLPLENKKAEDEKKEDVNTIAWSKYSETEEIKNLTGNQASLEIEELKKEMEILSENHFAEPIQYTSEIPESSMGKDMSKLFNELTKKDEIVTYLQDKNNRTTVFLVILTVLVFLLIVVAVLGFYVLLKRTKRIPTSSQTISNGYALKSLDFKTI